MRTQPRLSHCPPPRAGFTLIELLIVVAIIAILMALLSGAIRESVRNARRQRTIAERNALTSAIMNYWHDYNRWPLNTTGKNPRPGYTNDNWVVFNQLVDRNTADNPLGKSYIDESALTTTRGDNGSGERINLRKKRASGFNSGSDKSTLVDHGAKPYKVKFDLEGNTVTVESDSD